MWRSLSLFMFFCIPMTVFGMDPDGFWIYNLSEENVKPFCAKLKDSAEYLPFSMYQDHDCLKALIRVSSGLGIVMDMSKDKIQKTNSLFIGCMNSSRVAMNGGLYLIENFIKKVEMLEQEKSALKKQLEEKRQEEAAKVAQDLSQAKSSQSRLLSERNFFIRAFAVSALSTLVLFAYILYDKYR